MEMHDGTFCIDDCTAAVYYVQYLPTHYIIYLNNRLNAWLPIYST